MARIQILPQLLSWTGGNNVDTFLRPVTDTDPALSPMVRVLSVSLQPHALPPLLFQRLCSFLFLKIPFQIKFHLHVLCEAF